VRELIDDLENRVIEVFVCECRRGLPAGIAAKASGGFLRDAQKVEIAPLVACQVSGISLARVVLELGSGEAARQLAARAHSRGVEAGLEAGTPGDTGVEEEALVFLLSVISVAVLALVGEAGVGIERVACAAGGDGGAGVVPGADFEAGEAAGVGAAGAGDVVDRAAEGGGADGEGVTSAQHLDAGGGGGLEGLHVEAAIGEVDGHAVLEHDDAAAVEGALETGAADGEAGLIGAEAGLGKHAGRERKGVGEGAGAAIKIARGIDYFSAAWHAGKGFAGVGERARGERGGAFGGDCDW
jgi:hypothetical protein